MSLSYAYYPGCSLEASAKDYDMSMRAVAKALDVHLEEVPDWNCCGASSGFVVDSKAATAWCSRTLLFAEKQGLDMIIPCTGCLKNMNKALTKVKNSDAYRDYVAGALGESFGGRVRCLHPLEALVVDLGLDVVGAKVSRKLKGLKVASYYGCYIVRPTVDYDVPEDPQSLERMTKLCGATPVDFPLKTKCCGGGTFLTAESTALDLTLRIAESIKETDADLVLVGCPLCDMLLDAYQAKLDKKRGRALDLPVMYFTQFLGLALGLSPDVLGLDKRFVSVQPVLDKLAAVEAEEQKKEAERAAAKAQAASAQPGA